MPRGSYANRMRNLSVSLQWDAGRGFWLGGIVLFGAVLLALGDSARDALRYDRAALAAGQWWRALGAHAVHQDAHHFLLNALGLTLVWALFARDYRAGAWACIALAGALGISAGLWWGDPQVQWYLGASGVLHALMAAGCVKHLVEHRWDGWLLTGCLVVKLVFEQHQSAPMAGALPVIVDAHLYGALAGAAMAAALSAGAAIIRRSSQQG